MNSKPDFAYLFLPCEKIINIIQYIPTRKMGILSMRFARTGLFTIEMVRFICICVSVFCTGAAFAKSDTCGNGQFLFSTKCSTCPAGCYCTGGNTETMSLDPDNKIKASVLESYCKGERDTCPQGKAHGGEAYGACGRHNNAKLFRCPSGYAYSAAGATSITRCHAKCGNGQTLYYEQKSCNSGEYRPQGSNDCKPCPDDGKSYCTGVSDFYPTCDGASSDQGKSTCNIDKGKVPNSARTACVDKQCGAGEELKDGKCVSIKIHCIPGEYLPANSESCAACPSGKVCLGGDFDKRSIDQGDDGTCDSNSIINSKGSACIKCEAGTAPNATQTACTEAAIHVEPGYYLPANKITPTKCSGARKYCPGGNYKKGITDVGIFECPFSGRANADGTACNVSITEEQMQYGPAGKNAPLESQCWLRTDPDDYRTCIFGTRFDVSKDK